MFKEDQEIQEEPIAAIARDWNQMNRPQGPIVNISMVVSALLSTVSYLYEKNIGHSLSAYSQTG